MAKRKKHTAGGLRIVSVIEAAKGILVLIAGFGVLAFIHSDLHSVAEQLVRNSHLNPASHYPRIFIDAVTRLNDRHLWIIALSALTYSVVRFIEAIGLWHQMEWAEWFGVLTGGIYIPVEAFEVIEKKTWPVITLLLVNAGIVLYLGRVLYQSRKSARRAKK
ncbi:MAG: DUF2127 domain-containing protein [Nitrospiraceae bacterium]|nr:DUF2127 domain-containing protein [Nitrospiraceae bacterium]